jgi:hypothetical protein
METNDFHGDIFKWNIYTIIKYIKNHYIQFILLLFVFIIIYVVDYISNINAMIFTMPSAIPGVIAPTNKITTPKKIKKNRKK